MSEQLPADIATKTLLRIEERLEELEDNWVLISGRDVAREIINAIREARGDEPIDYSRPWSPGR